MAQDDRRGSRPPGGKGRRSQGSRPPSRSGPPKAKRGPGAKGTGGPPRARRSGGTRPAKPQRDDGRRGAKQWGGVARRGAGELETPRPDSASAAWREAVQRARDGNGAPVASEAPDEWIRETVDEDERGTAPGPAPAAVVLDA